MKATHYIAQFQRVVNQQSFRAEIFYKKYDNLIKTGLSVTSGKRLSTIMDLVMQRELNFSGGIRKQSRTWITGYRIHTWIQKEIS